MNRYKQREQALLLIFESQFSDDGKDELCNIFEENIEELGEYSKELFFRVYDNADILDEKIKAYSKGWRLSRIPKINIALLRLAIYESLFVDSVPASIAINEAVELGKKFGEDGSGAFINGVLAGISGKERSKRSSSDRDEKTSRPGSSSGGSVSERKGETFITRRI